MQRFNRSENADIQVMENEFPTLDRELNRMAWDLYWWMNLFQIAFFKDAPVPIPVLTFKRTRVNTMGTHRIGKNDWPVRDHININRIHLNRPFWSILATLLHEMVHLWESIYVPEHKRTKSWYHSKAFRAKMEECGILCNDNGSHVGLDGKGKFVLTLKQHAVSFAELPGMNYTHSGIVPIAPDPKVKGKSKLRKWTCGCQIVRVGKRDFRATCNICNNFFVMHD
jgi:hypothetical protein